MLHMHSISLYLVYNEIHGSRGNAADSYQDYLLKYRQQM